MMSATRRTLIVCLCLAPPVSIAAEDIFRLFFRYGFGDGQIGDPSSPPSEADVKGLMCATNQFFTHALQNSTKSDQVEFFATDITWGFEDWIYNGTEPEAPRNVPVIVNFTAKVLASDGSPLPTNQDLWEDTKYFEYFSYIQHYIWEIEGENFFKSTRGLWYEPFIQEPEQGQIADNDMCPSPAGGRDQKIDIPLVPAIPQNTPEPTPNPTLAPETTPPVVGRPGTFNLATLGPTLTEEEMVYFTVQIDFFAGREKEPTDAEVEAMMCHVDAFFQKTLKEKINPDVEVYSSNIHWEWDDRAGLPSMVEFFAHATYADGSFVPPEKVFDSMESVDVKQFVQDYIWMAEPYKENEFYQTEDIFFAGRYSGSSTPPEPRPGKLARANCP